MPKTRDPHPAASGPAPHDPPERLAAGSRTAESLGSGHPGAERLARTVTRLRARLAKGRFNALDRFLRAAEGYLTHELREPETFSVADLFATARGLGL
ncbi:MAG: hypothetical protein MI919_07445, partial [Holophagales bacterium]|nr:hypothetical protein [Holophagales bacterium]